MKKIVSCQIEPEQVKKKDYPLQGNIRIAVYVKSGDIKKSTHVTMVEKLDMVAEDLKDFLRKVDEIKSDYKITTSFSSSLSKEVTLDICEMCGIGTGSTRYPDGNFKHIEKKLVKLFQHDVCSECYEDYKDMDRKKFLNKLKKVQDEQN